jgi:hypothetical protein
MKHKQKSCLISIGFSREKNEFYFNEMVVRATLPRVIANAIRNRVLRNITNDVDDVDVDILRVFRQGAWSYDVRLDAFRHFTVQQMLQNTRLPLYWYDQEGDRVVHLTPYDFRVLTNLLIRR